MGNLVIGSLDWSIDAHEMSQCNCQVTGLRDCQRQAGERESGSHSVVESQPSKLLVAGSIPVSRSRLRQTFASLTAASRQARSVIRTRMEQRACLAEAESAARVSGGPASPKLRAQRGFSGGGPTCQAVARRAKADVAQLAERVLGKDEVTSSILVVGSRTFLARALMRSYGMF